MLSRMVDERRKDTLGLAEILGDAAAGVAADERADGNPAERCRRVDTGAEVGVVAVALGGIGCEVVVVVRERGQDEPVLVERSAHTLGLCLVEGVGLTWLAVNGRSPRCGQAAARAPHVAVRFRPRRDVLETALGHTRRQEAELHVATTESCHFLPRRPSALHGMRP